MTLQDKCKVITFATPLDRCEHDWTDYGICKKCDAKSLLHNKKMHSVWLPYD